MSRRRFEGQVVLVTGASSGIGEALSRQLAHEGARLILVARRKDRIAAIASEIGSENALAVTSDVTREGDIENAVAEGVRKFGRIDVVVANAGFSVSNRIDRLTIDDFRRQFETNVFGVLRTVYASLPELKKSRGRLVLLGSVLGHISIPGTAPYAMSKHAVRALAEAITDELRPSGVSVTLISPGFVESEIQQVDNRGVHHPGAEGDVPKWIMVPAARAAKEIAGAIHHRRRERVITGHGKVIVALTKYFPFVLRLLQRQVLASS